MTRGILIDREIDRQIKSRQIRRKIEWELDMYVERKMEYIFMKIDRKILTLKIIKDRQTVRKINRGKDRKIDRGKDRKIDRQKDRQIEKQKIEKNRRMIDYRRQTNKEINRQIDIRYWMYKSLEIYVDR